MTSFCVRASLRSPGSGLLEGVGEMNGTGGGNMTKKNLTGFLKDKKSSRRLMILKVRH